MKVNDDKVGTGDKVATDPSAGPKLARVILVAGCMVKPLRVQSVDELKVETDIITAEGRRLAELLYWGAPWRYFNGLRDRLNELQPPDNDRYGRPMDH